MNLRTLLLAAICALALGWGGQTGSGSANVAWLAVNVVGQDGRLLTDLTAGEFSIEVDGEQREIAAFLSNPIPVAMSLMVDTSSSMEANYGLVRRAVSALTAHFEPGDRAIVGSFDALPWISDRFSARPEVIQQDLSVALSATAVSGTLALCDGDWIDRTALSRRGTRLDGPSTEFSRRLAIHGGSAIWDGASCGINAAASDGETPRRALILLTDGMDTMSFSTVTQVAERADRLGVMIYAISLMGGYGVAGGDLRKLAEATGGGYFYLARQEDVSEAFARIGEELRHQYVLGFVPAGALEGARRIAVRTSVPGAVVKFRRVALNVPPGRSLSMRTSPRSPGPAPEPALPASFGGRTESSNVLADSTRASRPPASRTPLWDMLDRFSTTSWNSGQAPRMNLDQLRGMLASLRRDGHDWVDAVPGEAQWVRRIAVAGFVLDLLYSQNDPLVWLDRQPIPDMVEWAAGILRAGPASPEERLWYFGVLALCERAGAPSLLERMARRAADRFPDEARFVLARAIAEDLRTWPEERDERAFDPASDVRARLVARYREAATLPSVKAEAALRLGYFELRRGRVDDALEQFSQIDDKTLGDDVVLRFWVHLLRGRAFEQRGQLADAIDSYGLALEDVPAATSARAALIAALSQAGRGEEAARLAREALLMPAAFIDPWTMYVSPDIRFWTAISERLRQVVAR